jgi:hypothetical protein
VTQSQYKQKAGIMQNRIIITAATIAAITGVGLGAVATSASAATHAKPVISHTRIINRLDGGGNGPWANDTFNRTLTVNYLGKSIDPAHADAPYMYNAQISDAGSFRDLPGAFTPNQGGHNLGKHLKPVQVSGPMSGYGQFGMFYASNKAHNGLVPTSLRGNLVNSLYPSSTWPELAFPAGTTFVGVNEAVYDYNYQAVPSTKYVVNTVNGKRVIVTVHGFKQHWEDSAFNGDGQLQRDGNITGLNH